MQYKYKLKSGDIVEAFKNNSNGHVNLMQWKSADGHQMSRGVSAKLHYDADGREFFTYRDEKVYTDSFVAMTPQELVDAVNKKGHNLKAEELCQTLIRYGIDSLIVMVKKKPMEVYKFPGVKVGLESESVHDDLSKYDNVPYKFETYKTFKLDDNFKIKLVPLNECDREKYASCDYYVSDLVGLLVDRQDKYCIAVK